MHGRSVDSSGKVYSTDQVEIEVVNLKGVRVVSHLTHILSNEKMPLRVVGIADGSEIDTSLLIGGEAPIMSFEWILSNKECGELVQPFQVRFDLLITKRNIFIVNEKLQLKFPSIFFLI